MEIGAQKKRDIALVVVTLLLDRHEKYSAESIEEIIKENVRPSVLVRRGYAPDHIRRAMIENGYVERDPITNETSVAPNFVGFEDTHRQRIADLTGKMNSQPHAKGRCPECNIELKTAALLNHYLKKHAAAERWEQIVEESFGFDG